MMMMRKVAPLALGALIGIAACGPKQPTGVIQGPPDPIAPATEDGTATPQTPEAIIAASSLPAVLTSPLTVDPLGVEIHRLSNGLTVYISTNRTKPEFDAWIAVRSGSRNDPAESTGLAHYLEHMLFKGTSKLGTVDFAKEKVHLEQTAKLYDQLRAAPSDDERGRILAAIDAETQKAAAFAVPNEFDQLYAGLGISGVNAFTGDDQTVYIAQVPTNRLEAWAKVEGDRFADPQHRLFFPELEAVYEEKNRSLDAPSQRVFEAMFLKLYPKHPYGTQPTIGLTEHLKTPAFADMLAYYDRWYVPNNMAIMLAGDIDAATALPVLEREFARLSPKPLSYGPEARPAGDLAVVKGRQEAEVFAPGENAIYLAWRSPAPSSPDAETFRVLDLLMDNSTTGLLNTELVLTQKLPSAGSFVSSSKEAATYIIWGTARAGQSHSDVEALLRATLAKLQGGDFTQADIDAAIVNLEIDEKRKLQSNGARVREMTTAFINGQSWPAAVARLTRLRAVKRDRVIAAAKSLGADVTVVKRVSGRFEPPKINKPKITAVPIDTSRASAYANEIKAMPAKPLQPDFLLAGRDYQEHTLPAGSLITAHNTSNDLFALTYRWETGYRRDKLLCVAFDAVENSGTKENGPVALRKKLYAVGTSISFSCRADAVTISVTGIDRNLEASVELLRGWLASPAVESETVARLVANRVSERADLIAEPRFVAGALASYATDGTQSIFLAQPSNRDLENLGKRKTSGAELARRVSSILSMKHKTGYVGPRTPKSGDDMVAAIGLGKKHKRVRARAPARYRRVAKPTIYFVDKLAAQSQVRILWPHKPLPAQKMPLEQLYSEYVGGGLGALIGQEIREARGLAYSAWGGYSSGDRPRDAASLFGGLGTQVDKTSDALGALVGLLRGFKTVDAARFAVAKSSLLEAFRSARPDPRTTISRVWAWQDYGFKGDPYGEQYLAVGKTTAEDLATFANSLADGPYIVALTGDKKRLDMKALGALGRVIPVTPKKLVSW